jgi:hypothetical protein
MIKEALEKKTDEELRTIRSTLHKFTIEISAELNRRERRRKREQKIENVMRGQKPAAPPNLVLPNPTAAPKNRNF